MIPPQPTRPGGLLRTVVAGVVALGLLAGCGDDDRGDGGEEPDSGDATSTVATAAPDSGATAAEDYLPVPDGVELTAPGAQLGLTETATVAWRPRQDTVVALDITVDRIDRTSFEESFAGWVVTKEMQDQTPYFAHVTVRNAGDTDAGGLAVPLYSLESSGVLVEPLGFQQKQFRPCPGGPLPKRFRTGRSAELCLVYLSPRGSRLEAVAFDLVGDLEPVTWSGEITELEKRDEKRKKDRGRRDRD